MFRPLALYTLDDNPEFVGYAIQKSFEDSRVQKLHSVNYWTEAEVQSLKETLARLGDQQTVLGHWPDARDPEVTAILQNPDFMPPEYEPAEAIDEEHSVFVWDLPPNVDPQHPYGLMNEEKSVLVNKIIMAPTPASMQARTKAAQEIVARRRSARG